MHQYRIWIRLNASQTTHVMLYADSGLEAKMIAEAQYGVGNVLNYSQMD